MTAPRRRWRLPVAAALALAVVAAATCPDTNEPAPAVVTLTASKSTPATDAWVVSPTCKVETVRLADGRTLEVSSLGVERIVSVPTNTMKILLTGNPLSRGADLSKATKVTELATIGSSYAATSLALSPGLENFIINSNPDFVSFEGLQLPSTLRLFAAINCGLKTLKNAQFPASLIGLTFDKVKLTATDLQYVPPSVTQMLFISTPIGNLERVSFPSKLNHFTCRACGIKSVTGIRWPKTLKTLIFGENTINTFEIRESDVATFEKISFTGTITQTSCASGATLTEAGETTVCVISDSEFNSRYGYSPEPSVDVPSIGNSGNTPTPSESSRGSIGGSQADDGSGSALSPKKNSADGGSDGGSSQEQPDGSATGDPPDAANKTASGAGVTGGSQSVANLPAVSRRPATQDTPAAAATENGVSTSNSSLIVIILSCALSIAVVAIAYQLFVTRRRRQQKSVIETPGADKFDLANTPSTASDRHESKVSRLVSSDSLAIDLRNDKDLVRHRIGELHVGKQIARGGYGVVFRGTCLGRVVAVKQMLPGAWRNDTMVAVFLDEIRLCMRLDHPKIVEFIGVSWNSLRDLSVVSEFMPGGDLHSALRQYPESSGREWSAAWGQDNLKSKTLIATDVAEAVVYLHSFDAPIIHRDLKSKNVLLDTVGNAKLSDFGISREMSMDETMTSEIGTAAWIAPEVLRGERYSEKADIYSLGVLLVELDRCSHPYANDRVLLMGGSTRRGEVGGGGNTSRVAHKNTQIAVLVSTGQLRPSASSECTVNVAAVIDRCLTFDASERPTAREVFFELRQLTDTNVPRGYP